MEWSGQSKQSLYIQTPLCVKKTCEHTKQFAHWVKSDGTPCKANIKRSYMLGVRAISSICITRFARRKGAMIFEAKILSVHLNAYSEFD